MTSMTRLQSVGWPPNDQVQAGQRRRRQRSHPAPLIQCANLRQICNNSMTSVIILIVVAGLIALGANAQVKQLNDNNQTTNQTVIASGPASEQAAGVGQSATAAANANHQVNHQIKLQELPAGQTAPSGESKSANGTQTSTRAETSTTSAPVKQTSDQTQPPQAADSSQKTRANLVSTDLAVSSSSLSSSVAVDSDVQTKQPKRGSLTAQANRWTHFGARLKPLKGAAAPPDQNLDHYHEAASQSSGSKLATRMQQVAAPIGNQATSQPVRGNNIETSPGGGQNGGTNSNGIENNVGNEEDDDDDDLDSEALLYKLMQQSSFLMNSNFQEPVAQRQPATGSASRIQQVEPNLERSEQQAAAAAAADEAGLAKSKRVIKLLKSYSHIHQVDDTDDQIRGAYTRYSRPSSSVGRQQRPINNQQQHIFVSSLPVTTSQTRASTRFRAPNEEDDGQYRPSPAASRNQLGNESGEPQQEGAAEQPEEEEFECPNNGIFADVASGCQAYHVCQSASQVQQRFQCPLGTLFNDIILTCDFAHNVQCGKRPGELGSTNLQVTSLPAQPPSAPFTESSAAPQQQQVADARQRSPGSGQSFPVARQQQQAQSSPPRATAPSGPRQLVIGSPYNLHNSRQQQQPTQTENYPPIKPLSSSLSGAANTNDSDDDEPENESENEPLVPATLPPRANSSPYQPAPGATTMSSPQADFTSSRPQQPVYKSRYSQQVAPPPRPAPQQRQQPRARYQPVTEASALASSFGASAAPPTFVEPSQQQQQNGDSQSFSLVINHMAPALVQPTQKPQHNQQQPQQQQQQQQQQLRRPQQTSRLINQELANLRTPADSQRVASGVAGQQRPVQIVAGNPQAQPRAQPSVQQQLQQRQPVLQRFAAATQRKNLLSATLPPARQLTASTATGRFAQQSATGLAGSPQFQLRRVAAAPLTTTTTASYEEATASSQPSVSHQQRQTITQSISANNNNNNNNKIDNSEAAVDLAAQEIAVRNQQAQQQQQHRFSPPPQPQHQGDDVINDGMFLIIRHSAGAPALQLADAPNQRTSPAALAPVAASQRAQVAPAGGAPAKQHKRAQVYSLLPPMAPPAPQIHDHEHHEDPQKKRQQQQHYANANSDRLIPAASSVPKVETSAKLTPTTTSTSTTPTTTTTPATSTTAATPTSSQPSSSTEGHRRQLPARAKPKQQQQQPQHHRIRVSRRIKPAATPRRTNSTSVAPTRTNVRVQSLTQ